MYSYLNQNQEENLIEGIMFEMNPIQQIIESEEFMLNNRYGRCNMLNSNPGLVKVLDDIKYLNTMSDGYMTMQMVADYFEVGYRTLQKSIQRNQEELFMNGLVVLEGEELRQYKMSGILGDFMSPNNIKRSLTLLNRRVILNIAMLLRDSIVAKVIRYTILNVLDTVEGQFLLQQEVDRLQQELEKQTQRANHYQDAYEGIYPLYRELQDYVNTNMSYKYLYEDLLYRRGYYDHQAYADAYPYY